MLRIDAVAMILALGAFFGLTAVSAAQEHRLDRPTITVSGLGKMAAKPDVAEIQVGVVTHAPAAQAALAQNSTAMTKLLEILKEHGIAEKDIRTSQIQVNPQYSQVVNRPGEPQQEFVPRIVGYRVDNTVHVTARQIAKLGEVLDAVVQAGANQIHGISFRFDDPEKLLDEARTRAMADARRKAALLAGEARMVLGAVLRISEESTANPIVQFPMAARGALMGASAAVPVAPGEHEVRASVQVVYELREAK